MSGRPELPARPYLPPILFIAVGVCVFCAWLLGGVWSEFIDSGNCDIPVTSVIACIVIVFVLAVCAYYFKGRSRKFVIMSASAIGVVGASFFAVFAWSAAQQSSCEVLSHAASAYRYVVTSDASKSDSGYSFSAKVLWGGVDIGSVRMMGSELMYRGDSFQAVGRIKKLDDSDWARSRFMRGEVASVSIVKIAGDVEESINPLLRFRKALLKGIAPERDAARALLAGLICGYGTNLSDDELRDDFARAGLSHVIRVSGSHLAVVGTLVHEVLNRLKASRRTVLGASLIPLAAFVLFTGAAPSAVRSVCMVAAANIAHGGGRRGHGLSALGLTACFMVLLNPGVVLELGFQLSALSVFGIQVFSAYIAYTLEAMRLPSSVAGSLAPTLVAQAMTLPLTVPIFGQISTIAPISNLVVVPVVSLLLVAGVVCVPLMFLPVLSDIALAGIVGLSRCAVMLVRLFSSVPYASIPVVSSPLIGCVLMAGLALLFVTWPRPRARLIVTALLSVFILFAGTFVYWTRFAPASVTVLDVGQADAILIRDGSRTVLVDAGVDDAVLTALARNNVYRLDAVVITHWDQDHWGGLPDVLKNYPVDSIYVADGAASNTPSELLAYEDKIDELNRGDVLHVGGFSCKVSWPNNSVDGDENGESLVLLAKYLKKDAELSVLLTGDTELDQEREYARSVGDIDVLKLGHHGSAKSVDAELLEDLKPEVAIASAGEGNSYGHPTDECVNAVEEYGAKFLCTIDSGDVALYPGAEGIHLHCAKSATYGLE